MGELDSFYIGVDFLDLEHNSDVAVADLRHVAEANTFKAQPDIPIGGDV